MASTLPIVEVIGHSWRDSHEMHIRPPRRTSSHFLPRISDCSTGLFEMLPPEIRLMVLNAFDLECLETFRALNSGCHSLVQSLPDYRAIREHARDMLRVLTATKLLSHFTVGQLFAVLSTKRCVSCPQFGSYVFLPTLTRCCYPCLEVNPDLQVIKTAQARICYGLNQKQLETLPLVWSVPGTRSATLVTYEESISLVCTRQARDLGIAAHGSLEEMRLFAAAKWERIRKKHKATRVPRDGTQDPYPYVPRNPLAYHRYDHLLGLATTGCPYFCRTTQRAQDGLFCKGCVSECCDPTQPEVNDEYEIDGRGAESYWRWRMFTAYLDEEFMEHYKTCLPAQQVWSLHLDGKLSIKTFAYPY